MGKGHVKHRKKNYNYMEGHNCCLNSWSPRHSQFQRQLIVTYKQSLKLN